ncbi:MULTISPECIES: hypothetical protein [unclassified Mycolicibacterium]|uniref:hypothetical protein n=1 Tax=unclassified Mycolicibacterium TaxID=2636767 RepID=UPI002ED8AFEC
MTTREGVFDYDWLVIGSGFGGGVSALRLSEKGFHSEYVLTVLLPDDQESWRDVTASSSVHVDADTHVELLTYGPNADMLSLLYTVLVGDSSRVTRPLKWIAAIVRHPRRWLVTLWPLGWNRRTAMLLVMQSRDNAIAFRARKRWWGKGYRMSTAANADNPASTYIDQGNQAARWLAEYTGGIPQSNVLEALGNIPPPRTRSVAPSSAPTARRE